MRVSQVLIVFDKCAAGDGVEKRADSGDSAGYDSEHVQGTSS